MEQTTHVHNYERKRKLIMKTSKGYVLPRLMNACCAGMLCGYAVQVCCAGMLPRRGVGVRAVCRLAACALFGMSPHSLTVKNRVQNSATRKYHP